VRGGLVLITNTGNGEYVKGRPLNSSWVRLQSHVRINLTTKYASQIGGPKYKVGCKCAEAVKMYGSSPKKLPTNIMKKPPPIKITTIYNIGKIHNTLFNSFKTKLNVSLVGFIFTLLKSEI
jgi:hypothetical protein